MGSGIFRGAISIPSMYKYLLTLLRVNPGVCGQTMQQKAIGVNGIFNIVPGYGTLFLGSEGDFKPAAIENIHQLKIAEILSLNCSLRLTNNSE